MLKVTIDIVAHAEPEQHVPFAADASRWNQLCPSSKYWFTKDSDENKLP